MIRIDLFDYKSIILSCLNANSLKFNIKLQFKMKKVVLIFAMMHKPSSNRHLLLLRKTQMLR